MGINSGYLFPPRLSSTLDLLEPFHHRPFSGVLVESLTRTLFLHSVRETPYDTRVRYILDLQQENRFSTSVCISLRTLYAWKHGTYSQGYSEVEVSNEKRSTLSCRHLGTNAPSKKDVHLVSVRKRENCSVTVSHRETLEDSVFLYATKLGFSWLQLYKNWLQEKNGLNKDMKTVEPQRAGLPQYHNNNNNNNKFKVIQPFDFISLSWHCSHAITCVSHMEVSLQQILCNKDIEST